MWAVENYLSGFSKYSAGAELVFRLAVSLIFIIGGAGHFGQHEHMLARIEGSPWLEVVKAIGDLSWLLWLSGAVFIVTGIMLIIGLMTRTASLLILLTLLPITLSIHIAPGHVGPLFKNVAIMGALFYLMVQGAGKYSLDGNLLQGKD